LHRHARVAAAQRGGGDVVEPRRPAVAHVAGLGDEQRPFVAPVHLGEDVGRVAPARVAQVPVQPRVARVLPLVAVVIVEAQHVEVARRAAQRRLGRPHSMSHAWYCSAASAAACASNASAGLGGHHVDHGVGVHDARVGHTLHSASQPRSAARTRLHFRSKPRAGESGLKGMDQRGAGGCPAQERDLVDRLEDGRAFGFVLRARAISSHHAAKRRGEVGREHVHAGGHAVVVQRPDHLQPVPPRGAGACTRRCKLPLSASKARQPMLSRTVQNAQAASGGVVLVDPLPCPLLRFIASGTPRLFTWSAPS
jgi:hypothetical protein